MRKLKLLFAAAALILGASQTWAQTDVTSTYITNPGFEGESQQFLKINDDGRGVEKPIGWSVEWYQDNNDKNGMTFVDESMTQDSKTWNAKSGKAYFARMRWNVATLYLRQTLQNLRPGSYTLSFSAAAYSAAAGATVQVSVAGETQTILSDAGGNADGNWTDYNISFTVTSATPYATIEYKAKRGSDNFKVGIDEFSLKYDGSSYYNTILTAAQALYDENADWAENGLSDFSTAISTNSGKETIADKNAAIIALEEAMATFKAANSVDMTAKITNPNFDSNISGWTTTGGDGNAFGHQTSAQTNFTGGFLEKWRNGWNGGYNQKDFDVSQELSNLPNGEYTIQAYILAQMQGGKETLGDNYKDKKHGGPYYIDNNKGVWFYASSGENTANTWANSFTPTFGDTGGGVLRSATVKVENGKLKIGFKGIGSENGGTSLGTYANWIAYDTWTLSYFGFDPSTLLAQITSLKADASTLLEDENFLNVVGTERTDLTTASTLVPADEKKATLESAISQIEGAISTFTAAKANYDANAAEVIKATALGVASATISTYTAGSSTTAATALTNTQALKVAEFNFVKNTYNHGVTLGTWTSTATNTSAATFKNEHWSGKEHDYMNQNDNGGQGWNAQSWSIDFNQDVTLPAGNYVFKVAARQATGDNITTSLVVKQGETNLGTVDDFPRGNRGLGINTSGATDFTTGVGHTYACNGEGYGWEWRYVKFTLSEGATVNIAVKAVATDYHQWVSFGDYTLQTDNEANISLIAYNIALNDAKTARDNADYTNVTGDEKTALLAAIAADSSLDKNDKDAIEAATTALNEAREAFVDAKSAYDAFVAAKAVTYENNLPYASATYFAAIATAQTATATSASDATTKTNAIISAYRRYVESNALAEGVTGAENKTSLISDPNMDVTYDGTNHTFGAWQVFSQVDGTISLKTENDEPLTDSEGNKYKYADIWKADNNGGIKQTINLPAGKYLLTAAARAQDASGATFGLFAGNARTEISRIGNTGGVFGNGWNDAYVEFFVPTTSDVEIGVQSGNGKTMWWGATRFRLVRLGDAIETVSVSNAGMATLCSAYPLDFTGKDVKAYTASLTGEEGEKTVLLTRVYQVPANTGLVLKGAEGSYDIPFIASADAIEGNLMVGTLNETPVAASSEGSYNYMLANGANGVGFYYVASSTTSAAGKAYLHTTEALKDESGSGSRVVIIFSDHDNGTTTGIAEISKSGNTVNEKFYSLSGQQVNKPMKGLYILNGKKVIIK